MNLSAIEATEEAIARVDAAADEDWKARALYAVETVCLRVARFTPDAIWEYVEKPREPRALGPVMRRAAKLGYCRATGEYQPSEIRSKHCNPIRVWESLIA